MDIVLGVMSLAAPPLFALVVRNNVRALFYGVVSAWGLWVGAGEYHLATDPEYDSIAPGIMIMAGWLPALFYSGFCVALVAIVRWLSGAAAAKRSADGPRDGVESGRSFPKEPA